MANPVLQCTSCGTIYGIKRAACPNCGSTGAIATVKKSSPQSTAALRERAKGCLSFVMVIFVLGSGGLYSYSEYQMSAKRKNRLAQGQYSPPSADPDDLLPPDAPDDTPPPETRISDDALAVARQAISNTDSLTSEYFDANAATPDLLTFNYIHAGVLRPDLYVDAALANAGAVMQKVFTDPRFASVNAIRLSSHFIQLDPPGNRREIPVATMELSRAVANQVQWPTLTPLLFRRILAEKGKLELNPQLNGIIVTPAQFAALRNGMSYQQACQIIASPGELVSESKIPGAPGTSADLHTAMYTWKNTNGSCINAIFQNNRLMQKSQSGLANRQ